MIHPPSTRPSLLVRIRDPQDERAWGEFLEIYTPLILRLAHRSGLQDADAADLAQEVFRAVASAIDRWDPDPARGSFRGWLFRIARNQMINLVALQRRQPRGSGDSVVRLLLEQHAAPEPEDSLAFEREYRQRLFVWAAERVRGDVRMTTWDAFWKVGVECQDPCAVARELGMSTGAVYVAKSRVMARIRREIEAVEGN